MAAQKTDIYVYADWQGLCTPMLMGVLSAHQAKGRKAFSFAYDKEMNQIITEVTTVVKNWKSVAKQIGISRSEQDLMASAFNY